MVVIPYQCFGEPIFRGEEMHEVAFFLDLLPVKRGMIGCPEMLVRKYHDTLRDNP
jgi:hypothetical protein